MTPRLHRRFTELASTLAHLPLGSGPTPVRELRDLPGKATIWMKDEGAYGEGEWGGNKVRKLEWILPEARRRRAPAILTFGATGTNHGLATALYGREHGVPVALALVDQPLDEHVAAQLDRIERSGATVHRTRTKARTVAALPWLMLRHSSGLRPPYLLPAGGSSPIGALGYVEAAFEIAEQVEDGELPEPSHVVMAVGSGGTAAGLALGLRLAGLKTGVVGVVVSDLLDLGRPAIAKLAGKVQRLLRERGAPLSPGPPRLAPLEVTSEQLGAGYGQSTAAAREAAEVARERAGLRLDPVYTAKAFAHLLGAGQAGRLGDGPVLYLHTYGPRPR